MDHRKLYRLNERIKDSEEFTKQLKAEYNEMADELMEEWMETGNTLTNCDGRTIHLHTYTFAKKLADDEAVFAALRASGHGALIKGNVPAQTLASAVKEREEEDGHLPPEWDGIIEAGHKRSIRVRKA